MGNVFKYTLLQLVVMNKEAQKTQLYQKTSDRAVTETSKDKQIIVRYA